MAWGESHFLQSLGWATLNSFWQMALLWCIFILANSAFKISSHKKYQLSVGAVMMGFVWFVCTFFYYFNARQSSSIGFFNRSISESNSALNIFLISASTTYLILLIFPTYRLIRNFRFVQKIKKHGLIKAGLNHRLFVQKISSQLGIKKRVFVYLSELVTSPVTVGYLKPIVLLPVAALSNLTTQQVEAILLHELSHIRRFDYLVNFLISIISTFLYFNPFVKQFIRHIEEERENCCDQLVLQFGYDKLGYASALLALEKISMARYALALGAAGKSYLLTRIEKIVGIEKKNGFRKSQWGAVFAALLCIVIFNSILIIKEKKQENISFGFTDLASGFNIFQSNGDTRYGNHSTTPASRKQKQIILVAAAQNKNEKKFPVEIKTNDQQSPEIQPQEKNMLTYVVSDDVENSLTKEQKEKVKSTLDATKKVVANLQWNEVESSIADVLTEQEKVNAKKQYIDQLNKTVDWKRIELNMKAQYENMDWQKIDNNVNTALAAIQLDSLQKSYTVVLNQLNKLTQESKAKAEVSVCPSPDQSIEQIQKSIEELSTRVNTIKALRSPKKVVRL